MEPLVGPSTAGTDGMDVSDSYWSQNDQKVFAVLKPRRDERKGENARNQVPVTITNYKSLAVRTWGEKATLVEILLNGAHSLVPLNAESEDVIGLPDNVQRGCASNDDWIVVVHRRENPSSQHSDWPLVDIYLVTCQDAHRRLLAENIRAGMSPQLSAAGKYVIWCDTVADKWYSHDISADVTRCISGSIPGPFYREPKDQTFAAFYPPQPTGVSGWTEGDAAVLLNDRRDIWKVDPRGGSSPKNLTQNATRDRNLELRRFDYGIDYDADATAYTIRDGEKLYFRAFDAKTKEAGFLSCRLGATDQVEPLVLEPEQYYMWGLDVGYADLPGCLPPMRPRKRQNGPTCTW